MSSLCILCFDPIPLTNSVYVDIKEVRFPVHPICPKESNLKRARILNEVPKHVIERVLARIEFRTSIPPFEKEARESLAQAFRDVCDNLANRRKKEIGVL